MHLLDPLDPLFLQIGAEFIKVCPAAAAALSGMQPIIACLPCQCRFAGCTVHAFGLSGVCPPLLQRASKSAQSSGITVCHL